MELDGTLSELARLKSGSEPIVSLYLDIRWMDEQQRDRVRLFVHERVRQVLAQYLAGSPGREGLARTLTRIQGFVSAVTGQGIEPERSGLALFACEALGLWRPIFLGLSVENRLDTDHVPHLIELARLADDVGPAIVVVPGQDGADVYHVALGDLEVEARLRAPVPRSVSDSFKPSPSAPAHRSDREQKNERHDEQLARRNRRAAAAEVTALFQQRRGSKVVLVGTAGQVAAFERELPDRVRAEIVARVPRPRGWESGDGVRRDGIKAIAEAALARERDDEQKVVTAVVGEALRGGFGVLGPEDVVLALNEGRVHTLVLESDFQRAGYRCDNCGALGANAESTDVCPFCAGDLRTVHHLGEAMVARALADGGEVDIVPHGNKLHSYRGVAAFLRQTGATGLRGASHPWPAAPGANQP